MEVIRIDERLIQKIVEGITRLTQPDRVILFGSGATGQMTEDSDIDLLVLERDVQDMREESCRLYGSLVGLGIPLDIIVMRTERFEETKGVIGGIAYPANKYGKVIYEAA